MSRHLSQHPVSVFLVLLVALGRVATGGFPTRAQDATPVTASDVLPPDAIVDGLNLGEWHARYWQFEIGLLTTEADPWLDTTGARCSYGQHGPVFFLGYAPGSATVERSCGVPTGVTLFVPLQNVECSTIEPPPYYGANDAELRTCAAEHIDVGLDQDFPMNRLTVDGQVVDLTPYRAPSPLFPVVWPQDNEAGVPAGVAQSVGDGYAVMVGPLAEGKHVIEMAVPNGAHITYRLSASSGALTSAATPTV
jgi:hypothetical protein